MTDAPAPSLLQVFADQTASAFALVLWVAAGLYLALWLYGKLVTFGRTYDDNSAVARAMPDLVTLTCYAVTVAFGLFALFWLLGGFLGATKWFWFGKYLPQILNGLWITMQMLVLSLVV